MTLRGVLGGLLEGRFPRESGDFFTHILGLGGAPVSSLIKFLNS